MTETKPLIEIGFDKNGEMDFGILGTVRTLTLDQMNQLRQMIPVAIWCAEDMWRRNQPQVASQEDIKKLSLTIKDLPPTHQREDV